MRKWWQVVKNVAAAVKEKLQQAARASGRLLGRIGHAVRDLFNFMRERPAIVIAFALVLLFAAGLLAAPFFVAATLVLGPPLTGVVTVLMLGFIVAPVLGWVPAADIVMGVGRNVGREFGAWQQGCRAPADVELGMPPPRRDQDARPMPFIPIAASPDDTREARLEAKWRAARQRLPHRGLGRPGLAFFQPIPEMGAKEDDSDSKIEDDLYGSSPGSSEGARPPSA